MPKPPAKKRILYICALPKEEKNILRFTDEIGEIEDRLLAGQEREKFDFLPKLSVKPSSLRQVVIGSPNTPAPYVVHFSMHGDLEKGLVFSDANRDPVYQSAEYFTQLFELIVKIYDIKIEGIIFNVCHSEKFAQAVRQYVKFTIGTNSTVPDDASIAFSKGFYGSLFDGHEVKKAFASGVDAIYQWRCTDNDIDAPPEDGGKPYQNRFILL